MHDPWRQLPIILAGPAQLVFVLIIALPCLGAGQWWKKDVTQALVIKSATMLLLISAAIVGYITNDEWLVDLGYWLVCAAIYYQLAALIHERRRHRDD